MEIPKIGETIPLGNTTPVIPQVGETIPLIDKSRLLVKEIPESPKESRAKSIGKDWVKVMDNVSALSEASINIFAPGDENTLLKVGKYFEEAYNSGTIDDDAFSMLKEMIWSPLKNLGNDLKPIVEEGVIKGTPQAADNISRRPFSFALDVISALGIGKAASAATRGGIAYATGKSLKDIGARVAKSEAIQGARPAEALAEDLSDSFNTLDDKIKLSADSAIASLPNDPALGFTAQRVENLIDTTIKEVGKPISDAAENAVSTLEKYKVRIKKEYGAENIPAPEVKRIIMDLDDDIDWNTPKSNRSNRAIKSLRHSVDAQIKTSFPEYRDKMEELADLMQTREDASRLLRVVRRQGEWEIPDAAAARMDRLFKGGVAKSKSIEILNKFTDKTGLDIVENMDAYTFGKKFSAPENDATRTVLTGALIGGAFGDMKGAAAGAAIGKALNKYGGMALGKTINIAPDLLKTAGKIESAIPASTLAVPVLRQVKNTKDKEGK